MHGKGSDRRRFLKRGIALAGLAVGAVESVTGQALGPQTPEAVRPKPYGPYGDRSRFVTTGRKDDYTDPFPAKKVTPLEDVVGIITPSHLHFVANHSFPPDIDPQEHRFTLHGMVDHPLTFTLDELKRLPPESRIYFLECNGNSAHRKHLIVRPEETHDRNTGTPESVGDIHGRTSCSEWTGVLLSVLLKEAGVRKGARWIVSEGLDSSRFSHSLPLTKAMDDVLLAYGQNGEPIRPEQGYPLRLLVPGFRGPESVKWLRQIKVVDEPYFTRQDGNRFISEVPPKSVILRPSLGQRLPGRGFYAITGLAWSGAGAIRSVEVSIDNGRSWKDAKLQEPVHRFAHTRFHLPWTWNGEETVLQSRCTDERGQVQPTLEELRTSGQRGSVWNPIQPWKIDRAGSVQDAMEI